MSALLEWHAFFDGTKESGMNWRLKSGPLKMFWVVRNMYEGNMDNTKGDQDQGWEVGVAGGGVVEGNGDHCT